VRRHVHLVGIGGAGMSAIARILKERGEAVSGSDLTPSEYTRSLAESGVDVVYGHAPENIAGADLVVASSAVPDANVELQEALVQGITILRRAAFLGELTAGYRTIAVAGTHGKTTTSGLIAWLLDKSGMSPSFIVGGMLPNFGSNASVGTSPYFVIEADEYDHTFLGLNPSIAVVTNIEHDHPDCYPTPESFHQAFVEFSNLVQEVLIVCQDDPGASTLKVESGKRITYGMREDADWQATSIRSPEIGGTQFTLIHAGEKVGQVRILLPGSHNVLNSLAAIAVVHELGVDFEHVREALASFHGVARRFQLLGEQGGVIVVDDYAHHPTEIQATLKAARERFPEAEIWAVFQPHTFSRTRTLMGALVESFQDADHVIVTEIFASREALDPDLSGDVVAKRIQHRDVRFIGDLSKAAETLAREVVPGSVVLTLSAGDGNLVGKQLLERLEGEKG
jgi:UDP-N-acetylmuramate--alanine ligase